ncbi:amidase domain-containing protein [Paenibacillus aurantius]|uniref:Amidase domain-containing protein n=1 Tax=Paenibacillus aurantius TaxID=2918900 RepID=A0AA96RFK7_9BACL|nr:amidase domain-containing protein [Paenibacillus aurantius]WNQ12117.1 amidase domain-containing protein [Paenibacillus aurantius]
MTWKSVLYDYVQNRNRLDTEYETAQVAACTRDAAYLQLLEGRLRRLAASHRERGILPKKKETRLRIVNVTEENGEVQAVILLTQRLDYEQNGTIRTECRVERETVCLERSPAGWTIARIQPDIPELQPARAQLLVAAPDSFVPVFPGAREESPSPAYPPPVPGWLPDPPGMPAYPEQPVGLSAGRGDGFPPSPWRPAVPGGPLHLPSSSPLSSRTDAGLPGNGLPSPVPAISRPYYPGQSAGLNGPVLLSDGPGSGRRPSPGYPDLPEEPEASERVAVYDREAAGRYADTWWNSYNPRFLHFEVDCSNYVSQCLFAGGAPMNYTGKREAGWWFQGRSGKQELWSFSWAVANSLRLYLGGSRTGLRAETVTDPRRLKVGDVISYSWNGDGRFGHSTIVAGLDANGMPLVNAHTVNSKHRYWDYRDSYAWTERTEYRFFHIADSF